MRVLVLLAAAALLAAIPLGTSVAPAVDEVGDPRVYLRHPSPSSQVLPPQHRYCTAPAADLVWASAHEEGAALVARSRVVDPSAPLDCIAQTFEASQASQVLYVRMAESSPVLWLELEAHRGEFESTFASIWFRDGGRYLVTEAQFEDDGAGGVSFHVPLSGVAGETFTRAYDITGHAASFEAYAYAGFPAPLGAQYEAYDSIHVDVPLIWQI